ncbi:MAG: N-acetyl sugar amidotransferase [Candidatus Nitrosotenuis sp.]
MKYCKNCLMPDTRPGLVFDKDGTCAACINYAKQKTTDWASRLKEFRTLCDKHRGSNKNGYDCAIAVSGGKDSHFQVYYMKEVMKMNPILLAVGNTDWTETGRKNLDNLSDTFGCEILQLQLNKRAARILAKKTLEDLGQPTWYLDSLIYSYPYKMALQLGIKFLVYGENITYAYGGKFKTETPSAMLQPFNDVVKPYPEKWLENSDLTENDLQSTIPPSVEECEKFGLEPIYLSYFVPWDSHHNYDVARRWGFQHLAHEYIREGSIEQYNQIDSISYLLNLYLKYLKFAHSTATEMASRWIRAGLKTREEMIPLVEEYDKNLDQGTVEKFCEFTRMSVPEFWKIMDKWYNREFFEQDKDGVWHPKFKVGTGLIR